jgi:hypothetical protein
VISNCTPQVIEAVERASRRAAVKTHSELSRGLWILATCASTAVLVGVLGTVVQLITHTFYSYGSSRSTIIGVTAGLISKHMAFTATGLLVSLAACVFYRYLDGRMDVFDQEMEHAAGELVSALILSFGPLRQPAVQLPPKSPHEIPLDAPRFRHERMFRHAVLQLLWPRLTSEYDVESVLQCGMWVSFLYGYIGWLSCRWPRPAEGLAVLIFFLVAGLGLRAASFVAVLSLFAFFALAFVVSLVPFGWDFSSACLQIAPLLLFGTLKALLFLRNHPHGSAEGVLVRFRPLLDVAVVIAGLAACTAIVHSGSLSLMRVMGGLR